MSTTVDRTRELLRAAPDGVDGPETELERLKGLTAALLRENQQLKEALQSRIVIEQAKGVLAERYRLNVDEAFELLRRSARNHRLRLHALSAAVVASRETPNEIPPPRAA